MSGERKVSVTKRFRFEASHILPWHEGKCSRLHGHGYEFEVTVSGDLDPNGVVVDFDHLDEVVRAHVVDCLDHNHLNDLMANPTAEGLAIWIANVLAAADQPVSRVRVYETPDAWAEIEV